MGRMKPLGALSVLVLLAFAPLAGAEVTVRLKDGSALVGTIAKEDEKSLTVVTGSGVSVEVPRESVAEIFSGRATRAASVRDEPVRDDTRLFLGPTGRPLRRGTGYFSDHWVFFPGVAYGLSDNVTVAGGASLIPGLPLDEQVLFFTPKIGARLGSHASVAVGGLFARASGVTLSLPYVVSTFGSTPHHLTAALGFGHAGGDGGDGDSGPILMMGGSTRISRRFALMTENWIFPKEGFELFSAGFRIHGDRLSVDLGVVFNEDIVDAGMPVPWLSFSYHFGPQRREN